MFDGHFRANAEQSCSPLVRRSGAPESAPIISRRSGWSWPLAASVAIGAGALRAGLVLLVLTALPDVLDGAVAKASGTASPRGAFFDSVSDRLTDALLLGGVAWYLATTQPGRVAVLPLAVSAASMLVSYERAKADSLGFDARGGLMERAERLVALGIGLLFSQVLVAVLWVMLILTLFTAGQRFAKVWSQAPSARPRDRRDGPIDRRAAGSLAVRRATGGAVHGNAPPPDPRWCRSTGSMPPFGPAPLRRERCRARPSPRPLGSSEPERPGR